MSANPFPEEALAANRSGALTDDQARVWTQIAQGRRKGFRGAAYLAAAIGVLLAIADGPAAKAGMRRAVGAGCLGIAVIVLVASTRESLTADVREGRVEATEGAIARHRVQGRSTSSFYLDVAGRHLRTGRDFYDAAPDAGFVRVYFLPRSRRVVNLERLADQPVRADAEGARAMVNELAGAVSRHDPVALAEARAHAAPLMHAIEDASHPRARPSGAVRPKAEDLRGSWTSALMTLSFAEDGTVTATILGGVRRTGHWSIDPTGRLLTDVTGTMSPADAWLAGNELTITMGDKGLTFTRLANE